MPCYRHFSHCLYAHLLFARNGATYALVRAITSRDRARTTRPALYRDAMTPRLRTGALRTPGQQAPARRKLKPAPWGTLAPQRAAAAVPSLAHDALLLWFGAFSVPYLTPPPVAHFAGIAGGMLRAGGALWTKRRRARHYFRKRDLPT